MIPYDFEYYRPGSIEEATRLFHLLDKQGKQPVYYSGGTELITLGRVKRVVTGAVIDIKGIPECHVLQMEQNRLVMGAAVPLTKLIEGNPFPLLSKTAGEIADRTARNKITLGGNVCGSIYYREAVLPLLLTDSRVGIADEKGIKVVPIEQVFDQNIQLAKGELLVQVITDQRDLHLPFFSVKKRKQWNIGYPLLTVAALKKGDDIRVAFSGVYPFPFRDKGMETTLNNKQLTPEARAEQAVQSLSGPILDNVEGSADYRLFVLKNTLLDVLEGLEG
ncbi:FAD binding domain-containing protein [Desmospora profundinema]|uniref:CO/xanthine dehydrogenase FAD-binding subunit n=1 Tax=Desmospora profundinema TaxID=1571184 RepID=A0ABU1IPT6_9BACL|nr:FAD binding domain-containing protein [Desmospora profundinema]MDR6226783.1 CO/xanthine dehydrogenase FAD-binding subunit [Desmospora profundinema]